MNGIARLVPGRNPLSTSRRRARAAYAWTRLHQFVDSSEPADPCADGLQSGLEIRLTWGERGRA